MKTLFFLILICASTAAFSQTEIPIADVAKHIGDSVTIQDKVYGVKTFDNGMTLLNIGGKYPNHLLTVMIPAKVKATIGFDLDQHFKNVVPVSITGKLIDYKGKPEIILNNYSQLKMVAVKD